MSKEDDYVSAFLSGIDESQKDEIFMWLLDESDEAAFDELRIFRRSFKLFCKETCPGLKYFCGHRKEDYEDYCDDCAGQFAESISKESNDFTKDDGM